MHCTLCVCTASRKTAATADGLRLQNICCLSSRSEALECEACEEAARHVLVHRVSTGADLSLGPVCAVQLECRSKALQVCLHFGVNVEGMSAC